MSRRASLAAALLLCACHRAREPPAEKVEALTATASTAQRHGDQQDESWVPAEHKKGGARWKDVGLYVDGRPISVLAFGELPLSLEPVWFEEEVSAPKKPGSKDPGFRRVKQRRYRFVDYLRAVGVELKKVKELHVYGPRFSETIVVSGEELRARGQGFMFRFGGEVWGKPIPVVPQGLGNGKTPDKISAVLVYIDKTPPTLVRNEGMELDGELITGVPYYGEPMRGGVRVYIDDRIAAIIKRRLLDDPRMVERAADGKGGFGLFRFLEAQGVHTQKLVEGWIIKADRRVQRLPRGELERLSFTVTPQAKGEIHLGDGTANAIALHTRAVRPEELPVILADEEMDPSDFEN